MQANEFSNYYQLAKAFEDFGASYSKLNTTTFGPIEEVDIEKLNADAYPFLFVSPGVVTLEEGAAVVSFDIVVGDQEHPDLEHRKEALSETLYIIKDVVAYLKNNQQSSTEFPFRSTLTMPVACEPFLARFNTSVVGWAATIDLIVDNTNDFCLVT